MNDITRESPVDFGIEADRKKIWNGWNIALAYREVSETPFLVDLTHRPKLDIQDREVNRLSPWDISMPLNPGECELREGILVNRLNATQAILWHLTGDCREFPLATSYTDITEASILLGLCGQSVFDLSEKLSDLDLRNPHKKSPFALQGPFSHVPCQIVVIQTENNANILLISCSRGYARGMVQAIMSAGKEYGLHPGGVERFESILSR